MVKRGRQRSARDDRKPLQTLCLAAVKTMAHTFDAAAPRSFAGTLDLRGL
jgi:hypothetical protein